MFMSEMVNHLVIVLLLTTSGVVAQPPRLPNIDYLGDGYDIVHGNPHENQEDPGFRQAIFRLDYASKAVSADGKWLLPDYVDARQVLSCSFGAESREVTGTTSYRDSLSVEASVQGGMLGFEFSASTEYNKIRQNTESNHLLYTSATAKCSRYRAHITRLTAVNFNDPFIQGVQNLPLKADNEPYLEFISVFGTHYISKMTMGAKFVITSEFDENSWTSFEQEGLNIKLAASANLLVFSAGASVATDKQKTMSKTFDSKRLSRTESYLGSRPPIDGKWETWAKDAGNDPYPISYVLRPITDLLNIFYFPNMSPADLRAKRNNLTAMYSAYCSSIENCGEASPDRVPLRLNGVLTRVRGVQLVTCRPGFSLLSCGLRGLDTSSYYDLNRYAFPFDGQSCECRDNVGGQCQAWCANTIPGFQISTTSGASGFRAMCPKGHKAAGCTNRPRGNAAWHNYAYPTPTGDGCECYHQYSVSCYATCLANFTNYEVRSMYGNGWVTVTCSGTNRVFGCAQKTADLGRERFRSFLVTEGRSNSCTCYDHYGSTCYAMCGQFI